MAYETCPECDGEGEVFHRGGFDTCPKCHGKGFLHG